MPCITDRKDFLSNPAVVKTNNCQSATSAPTMTKRMPIGNGERRLPECGLAAHAPLTKLAPTPSALPGAVPTGCLYVGSMSAIWRERIEPCVVPASYMWTQVPFILSGAPPCGARAGNKANSRRIRRRGFRPWLTGPVIRSAGSATIRFPCAKARAPCSVTGMRAPNGGASKLAASRRVTARAETASPGP